MLLVLALVRFGLMKPDLAILFSSACINIKPDLVKPLSKFDVNLQLYILKKKLSRVTKKKVSVSSR